MNIGNRNLSSKVYEALVLKLNEEELQADRDIKKANKKVIRKIKNLSKITFQKSQNEMFFRQSTSQIYLQKLICFF